MAQVDVDLNAPTIPADRRVWRLFPGRGYRFLKPIIEQSLAYLDFPGLELPHGRIADDPDMIAKIARSQEIRSKLIKDGPLVIPEVGPVGDFRAVKDSGHRSRLRQAIINLFEEAKQDDYVVTPEPLNRGMIWIGRFVSDGIVNAYYEKYGGVPIWARPVSWHGPFAENTVSTKLTQYLRHENPFSLLGRDTYLEIFSLFHSSFVYRDTHSAIIYNDLDDFLDADSAFIGAVSKLASAACQALDQGDDVLTEESLLDILLRNPPIEYTCSQQSDIHSRGFNRFNSVMVVALVVSALVGALITLGVESSKETLANDVEQLHFVNSGDGADPLCTAKVSDASKMVLDVLGIEKTWALCEAARAARERAGLRSSATPHRGAAKK